MPQRPSSVPGITATGLLPLQPFMAERGLDWHQQLANAGIAEELAYDPDALVPAASALQLLEVAARDCQNDGFGLLFGETLPVNLVGAQAYVTLNAPDLRTLLQDIVRYQRLTVTAYTSHYEETDGRGRFGMDIPAALGPRTQFVDLLFVCTIAHIRYATAGHDFPIHVDLERPTPRHPEDFARAMGRHIRFDRPYNQISIDARYLSLALVGADPGLYRVVRQHADDVLLRRAAATDVVQQVTAYIGDALKHGTATLNEAAVRVSMSPRALQRELYRSGTTFRDLVDDTRKSLAEHFLLGTSLPLTEIAFLLGFSELSAFSRAARTWFGSSPRQLRKAARPEDSVPANGARSEAATLVKVV